MWGNDALRVVKSKTAGEIFIYGDMEVIPDGVPIWFIDSEWEFAQKLSKALRHDAEQTKSFWGTLLEKKQADNSYSLFTDFPQEPPQPLSDKGAMAQKYCGPVITMLRKGKDNV